ncbi:MAG: hypothetical protein QXW80_04535 [Candidatus Micrarchaeia archaeon]
MKSEEDAERVKDNRNLREGGSENRMRSKDEIKLGYYNNYNSSEPKGPFQHLLKVFPRGEN